MYTKGFVKVWKKIGSENRPETEHRNYTGPLPKRKFHKDNTAQRSPHNCDVVVWSPGVDFVPARPCTPPPATTQPHPAGLPHSLQLTGQTTHTTESHGIQGLFTSRDTQPPTEPADDAYTAPPILPAAPSLPPPPPALNHLL